MLHSLSTAATETEAPRTLDLEPGDWARVAWRPHQPIERPVPKAFDVWDAAARMSRIGAKSYTDWDWTRAGIALGLAPEEARFWLAALRAPHPSPPRRGRSPRGNTSCEADLRPFSHDAFGQLAGFGGVAFADEQQGLAVDDALEDALSIRLRQPLERHHLRPELGKQLRQLRVLGSEPGFELAPDAAGQRRRGAVGEDGDRQRPSLDAGRKDVIAVRGIVADINQLTGRGGLLIDRGVGGGVVCGDGDEKCAVGVPPFITALE